MMRRRTVQNTVIRASRERSVAVENEIPTQYPPKETKVYQKKLLKSLRGELKIQMAEETIDHAIALLTPTEIFPTLYNINT